MSPGGSTPSSSRSCPELPPLSNIVTTALRLSHGFCFKPPSRLGNPVPPPKQPTFNWRRRIADILYNGRMAIPDAARTLERDLRGIFGSRLQSLVIYGQHAAGRDDSQAGHGGHGRAAPTRTLAIIASMTLDDLRAAARQVARWHDAGLATPLVIEAGEFERSLDAF